MLRNLVGMDLAEVRVDLVRFAGMDDPEPHQLTLKFTQEGRDDSDSTVSLLTGSDGESLKISKKPFDVIPQGEESFEVKSQVDQSSEPQWMPFVGRPLIDVFEIRDLAFGGKGIWCGLEFEFEGGAILSAFNWGDQLLVTAPPEDTGFLERNSLLKKDDDGSDDSSDSEDSESSEGRSRSSRRDRGQDRSDSSDSDDSDEGEEDDREDSEDSESEDENDSGSDRPRRSRNRRRRRRSRSSRGDSGSSSTGSDS